MAAEPFLTGNLLYLSPDFKKDTFYLIL